MLLHSSCLLCSPQVRRPSSVSGVNWTLGFYSPFPCLGFQALLPHIDLISYHLPFTGISRLGCARSSHVRQFALPADLIVSVQCEGQLCWNFRHLDILWWVNPRASLSVFIYFVRSITPGILVILFFQCVDALLGPVNRKKGDTKRGLIAHTSAVSSFVMISTGMSLDIQSVFYIGGREFTGDTVLPPGPLGYQVGSQCCVPLEPVAIRWPLGKLYDNLSRPGA